MLDFDFYVYLVHGHRIDVDDPLRVVGVFATESAAKTAVERAKRLCPNFSFIIDRRTVSE